MRPNNLNYRWIYQGETTVTVISLHWTFATGKEAPVELPMFLMRPRNDSQIPHSTYLWNTPPRWKDLQPDKTDILAE